MLRQMIRINQEKCNGCGACVSACHEGAIAMRDGKAVLIRDDYCDGLGNCLPVCPTGAISFEEREALPFDPEAVERSRLKIHQPEGVNHGGGCPGSRSFTINPASPMSVAMPSPDTESCSELRQWPVQIKLVPVEAPFFDEARILIAADCSAFACGDFHQRFMQGRVTLVGCPKLDSGDYSEKLTEIFKYNNVREVMLVRMEVPCCGGLERAVMTAVQNCGKMLPCKIVTLSRIGQVVER